MTVDTPSITDSNSISSLSQISGNTVLAAKRLLGPQWASEVQVKTRFINKTIFSGNHKPVTRLHSPRPVRTLEYEVLEGGYSDGSRRFNDEILRGLAKWIEPIWPDAVVVSSLSSGNTSASSLASEGKFTDRRFVEGQIAVILEFGSKTKFEYRELTSVTDTTIEFSSLTNSYSDPVVIPCMVSDINTSGNMGFRTGNVAQSKVFRTEVLSGYTIPAFSTPGENPEGYQTYNDFPILDPEHDWGSALDVSIERPSSSTNVGLARFLETKTERPLKGWDIRARTDNSADTADLQRFIESRGGSTYPFWLLEPTEDLVFYQGGNNTLVVGPSSSFGAKESSGFEKIDFMTRPYVYWINPADGTIYIRKIQAAIKNIGAWFLVLDGDPLPISDDLNSRVGFASFCRFQSEYTETWNTDRHCDLLASCEEIESSANLEVPDFSPQTGTPFEIQWSTNSCVVSDECRSIYRCDECCMSENGRAIVSISLTRVSCLEGSEVAGSNTITAVGIAEFQPSLPDSLTRLRQFGDFSSDLINATVTIQSTGEWPDSDDGVYAAEMEAEIEGCDVPEIRRIGVSFGSVTGGTFTLAIQGIETAPLSYDSTAETVRTSLLEAAEALEEELIVEVSGGPLGSDDFLIYVWGRGDIPFSSIVLDDSLLTGSFSLSHTTERDGTEYEFKRASARIFTPAGSPVTVDLTAYIDTDPPFGEPNGKVALGIAPYSLYSWSVDCTGASGVGTDPACSDTANVSRSFTVEVV